MNATERNNLYQDALNTYGMNSQVFMVVEECGELLNALAKYDRGRAQASDVITELADVSIMVEQMAIAFGYGDYIEEKERKLQRLKQRIEKTHKNAENG